MKTAKHRGFRAVALVVLASTTTAAIAQQADLPTSIAQKNQQAAAELAASGPSGGEPVVSDPAVRAELPPPGGPTVLLTSVVFDPPSEFLSAAELDAITSNYVGRHLDFSQISALVRDVNDLYAQKGIVTASAILPPQELASGELHVQLVEGRLGKVTVVGDHRTNNKLFFDGVRLTRGDNNVVDVPTAAQDILRFNKTHHAQLSLLLQPGAAFGLTDLALGVTEPAPVTLTVSADNEGTASTGTLQASASVRTFGLLGIDDSLLIHGTVSEGSMAGTASFDVPISPFGTRIALGLNASSIHVVDGPTEPLDISGLSLGGTATVTQALVARPDLTVIGLISASYGLSQSFSGDTQLVDTATTKAAIGASMSYSNEKISISAQPQLIYALADNLMADTQRGLVIVAGNFSAAMPVAENVHVETRGAFQYSPDALLPGSLLFQIGGPGTVRGYPSDGVGGDSGYFIQTEVHWTPPETERLDLYALADLGTVFSTFPPSTTLASVGAGMSYAWENGASAEVTLAVPVFQSMDDQADFAIYGKVAGSFD